MPIKFRYWTSEARNWNRHCKGLETGIRPIINTGIAHKDYGVGQIGAGLVNPPEGCFTKAIEACAKAWTN